jgi:hypothetical protein
VNDRLHPDTAVDRINTVVKHVFDTGYTGALPLSINWDSTPEDLALAPPFERLTAYVSTDPAIYVDKRAFVAGVAEHTGLLQVVLSAPANAAQDVRELAMRVIYSFTHPPYDLNIVIKSISKARARIKTGISHAVMVEFSYYTDGVVQPSDNVPMPTLLYSYDRITPAEAEADWEAN